MTLEKPSVVFLLAIWGKTYINQFFNFSLRSLLAPGNIPAMSEDYACTFLFLTTRGDIQTLQRQPQFLLLQRYCNIKFIEIKDLIFKGNYAVTLTLAFERGVRSMGKKMCETYFFFLVGDYIIANDSFKNLKRLMQAGYSGITTGNFLVVEEYLTQKLKEISAKHDQGLIDLNARSLLTLALPYLHPVTLAQTVTQENIHATHANRLFWKINDKTILGRFYLRHMLCIKPEVDNYLIGAYCDYSFIHEMCPSGNVAHIQDSDDYCSIEISPFYHEMAFIESGPHDIQKLANHLSSWTTQQHRSNAHIPTLFHCDALDTLSNPESIYGRALQESDHFIQKIESLLIQHSQPIRGHCFWLSCLESILYQVMRRNANLCDIAQDSFAAIVESEIVFPILNKGRDDRFLLSLSYPPPSLSLTPKQKQRAALKRAIAGVSPQTTFWHLHWYDDLQFRKAVKKNSLLIAFEPISEIIKWLEKENPGLCTYQFYDFFKKRTGAELDALFAEKKNIFICMTEAYLNEFGTVMRTCAKYLSGRQISVHFTLKKPIKAKHFNNSISMLIADLHHSNIICEKKRFYYNHSKVLLHYFYNKCEKKLFARRKAFLQRMLALIGLLLLNVGCICGNFFLLMGITFKRKNTSAILQFTDHGK